VDNLASNVNSTRAASNGADTLQPATVAKPAMRPSEAHHDRMTQSFANVVAVLMRDPGFRNLRLADLEWLVLPPILSGQWRLAHSSAQPPSAKPGDAKPESRMLVPVAVALWASVSPEIDKRLSENLDKPMKLRPNEWLTGNIPWLVAVAADRRAFPKFLKQLEENEFKGKQVKLRANGPDGKVVVKMLSQSE
jgi:hemolysin-activating ACP:hemolysin acyltransferase